MLIKRAYAEKISSFIDNVIKHDETCKERGVVFFTQACMNNFIEFAQEIGPDAVRIQGENNATRTIIFDKYFADGGTTDAEGKRALTSENQPKADQEFTDFVNQEVEIGTKAKYNIKVKDIDLVPLSIYFECKAVFNDNAKFNK